MMKIMVDPDLLMRASADGRKAFKYILGQKDEHSYVVESNETLVVTKT